MKSLLFGFLYVGIWASTAALGGISAMYSRMAEKRGPPYWRAWIVYGVVMALCLVIFAVIHEIDRSGLVDEVYGWIGPAVAILTFSAVLVRSYFKERKVYKADNSDEPKIEDNTRFKK